MRNELALGHQAYVVCRLIDKNEIIKNQESVFETYEYFKSSFPEYNVGIVHGKMKQAEMNEVIEAFRKNEIQILVSTTVIEVGVNVPNATVINIRNFDNMGLAGLHQLRGRVGRGSLQSYCLLSRTKDKPSSEKDVFEKIANGFDVSKEDMSLRGMGEILGEKQSGNDDIVEFIVEYPELFEAADSLVNPKD